METRDKEVRNDVGVIIEILLHVISVVHCGSFASEILSALPNMK